MTIGEQVRTLREARGWTQVDLAVRASVSPSTIHALETDKGRRLRSTVALVARALGVKQSQLACDSAADRADEAA